MTFRIRGESELDNISWHDAHVYAIAFDDTNRRLLLDIDFIEEWRLREDGAPVYEFTVVPATLAFRDVGDVDIDISAYTLEVGFDIDSLQYEGLPKPTAVESRPGTIARLWTVDIIQDGDIRVSSTGFDLYYRTEPVLLERQTIDFIKRGGFSFACEQTAAPDVNFTRPSGGIEEPDRQDALSDRKAEDLNWQGTTIRALAFDPLNNDVLLEIDCPTNLQTEPYIDPLFSRATLLFHGAWDVEILIPSILRDRKINDISCAKIPYRESESDDPRKVDHTWAISLAGSGHIRINSVAPSLYYGPERC
jgi:hypothetical protein